MTGQSLISKKLPKKQHQNNNKKPEENKEKAKREPLFFPPENWQEEVKAGFSLQTVIPASQEKFLKENKPNFNDVKAQQEKLKEQKGKLVGQITQINQEIKKINNETQFQLESIKTEINKIREELNPKLSQKKDIQNERDQHKTKIEAIKKEIETITKGLYKKRKWRKEELLDILESKEEEMRNKKLTATEEKSYLAEIEKIESSLLSLDRLEQLNDQYVVINNGLKGVDIKGLNKDLKEKFERLKVLQEQRTELKRIQSAMNTGEEKSKAISEAEQKLLHKKDQIQKQINEINENVQKVFENYQLQIKNYQQVQFEENKRNFMLKLQRDLKYEQKKKENEERKIQREKELVERERSKIGFLHSEEISKCQQIYQFLERIQQSNQGQEEQEEIEQEEITEIDGMKVINKKTKPMAKAPVKKDKKKKEKKVSDGKVQLSLQILQEMYQLKITPPVKEENIKDTMAQIQEKIKQFEELRKNALESFDPEQALKKVKEQIQDEDEEDSERKPAKNNKRKQGQKVEEQDFPEL